MTALLVTIALVGLLLYGLERNHARLSGLQPPLAGSADFDDWDADRVRAQVQAVAVRRPCRN